MRHCQRPAGRPECARRVRGKWQDSKRLLGLVHNSYIYPHAPKCFTMATIGECHQRLPLQMGYALCTGLHFYFHFFKIFIPQTFESVTPDLDHVGWQTVKSTHNSILSLLEWFSVELWASVNMKLHFCFCLSYVLKFYLNSNFASNIS